jgi:hypothetical protein
MNRWKALGFGLEAVMSGDRRIVRKEVADWSTWDDCGEELASLPEFIAELQRLLDKIPPEYREQAKVSLRASGDYAGAYLNVTYDRPETDAEIETRLAQHQQYKAEQEARERRMLVALKAKYDE